MLYKSTRASTPLRTFQEILFLGLSPEGGLFIPETIPRLTVPSPPPSRIQDWSFLIFRLYIAQHEIPDPDLKQIINKAFATFETEDWMKRLGDGLWLLELWHGPTFAFKDVALQVVGALFEYFLKKNNSTTPLNVLAATSGDTGSAAIYGLRNKANINVFILHPQNRISPVQYAQMCSVLDENVVNVQVKDGTFDECQSVVKGVFGKEDFRKKYNLAAVNSINFARILSQITYYYYSFHHPNLPSPISYSVPTGNFGDILAGFYAHSMGLPINKLICATNENDILHQFFTTGIYKKGIQCKMTKSPAMDILVSSNFERLLYYCVDGPDSLKNTRINEWMGRVNSVGEFKVDEKTLMNAKKIFLSGSVGDKECLSGIKKWYDEKKVVLDPHTVVGLIQATRHSLSGTTICISTASPGKFPESVKEALGVDLSNQFTPKALQKCKGLETRCLTMDFMGEGKTKVEVGVERVMELIKGVNSK